MTLAEIFLLLLFVVWYGYTTKTRHDSLAIQKEQLRILQKENERLARDRSSRDQQITKLERELRLWHEVTGLGEPPSVVSEICRSSPKCDENDNVLVHASARGGQISMKVLREPPGLSKWLAEPGRSNPPVGVEISDPVMVQGFLDAIRSYYSTALINRKICRFDYRLDYETKDDYYDAREKFEKYFYPAKVTRVTGRSQ